MEALRPLLREEFFLPVLVSVSVACACAFTLDLLSGLISRAAPAFKKVMATRNVSSSRGPYIVLVGMLIGCSVAAPDLLKGSIGAFLGGVLSFLGLKIFKWTVKKLEEEKRVGEVLLLYEVISVYVSAGYTLYEALSAASYLVDRLEAPLKKCLNSWSQGPERALKRFGDEVGVPEAEALSRILRRALVVGAGKLAEYLSQEGKTLEASRQFRIERGLGVRPVVQTLYLFLPGLALLGVTLMPVGYHIAKAIRSIRLS